MTTVLIVDDDPDIREAMAMVLDGYGYQICALISLLQLGLTYVQVPVSLNAELKGSSRALRLRPYFELGGTIVSLLRRVPIRHVDLSQVPTDAERAPAR